MKQAIFFSVLLCLLVYNRIVFAQEELEDYEYYDENEAMQSLKASCSLDGIPEDTSTSNRFALDPIPDDLQAGVPCGVYNYVGPTNLTGGIGHAHYSYITARNVGSYVLVGNALTSTFTRTFKTREMFRSINLICLDGTRHPYHFKIPVQDMNPPEFLSDEYHFNITSDWDRNVPISEGKFVIVGDTAFEIEEDDNFLKYSFSNDILRIEKSRLWVEAYPEIFYYRLDIFLKDSANLVEGEHLQVALSAKDQFNTGFTMINIYVA